MVAERDIVIVGIVLCFQRVWFFQPCSSPRACWPTNRVLVSERTLPPVHSSLFMQQCSSCHFLSSTVPAWTSLTARCPLQIDNPALKPQWVTSALSHNCLSWYWPAWVLKELWALQLQSSCSAQGIKKKTLLLSVQLYTSASNLRRRGRRRRPSLIQQ